MTAPCCPAHALQTRASLSADLQALAVTEGDVLLVHASLGAMGWIAGGPAAVIEALQEVLTPQGTLVMPAHTPDLTDPAGWGRPAAPEPWWPVIRQTLPAYDPRCTPSRGMGAVAELFRTWPGVRRSGHPHVSFAAWGREAGRVTEDHRLSPSLGNGSPLARLYDLNARILLLGTQKNTSLHLAQERAGGLKTVQTGAPMWVDRKRQWVSFEDSDYDDSTFPDVKAAFEAAGGVRLGRVGQATARLMSQRLLVDFAEQFWRSCP